MLSISTFKVAQASSTKSIALSGRKRSVIYRSDNVAAAIKLSSRIRTPWYDSKRSFKPRKILIVSSTLGSCTLTLWKRLSKAASFSMYLRYSLNVVAPIQCNSPRANIGFNKLAASMLPSVLPAPTRLWISSINRMICPFDFLTSSKIAFKRSSNSPRYLAPAINDPISNSINRFSFNDSGTSFFMIRQAIPSTTAVLPTPGSPIKTGLFFVLRDKICITRRISSSRPMMGSIFPSLTSCTRSRPYFFKASTFSSEFGVSNFLPFLLSNSASLACFSFKPNALTNCFET